MAYNPNIHNRKSIRLKGYDYSKAGLYFVTICCQNRECFFGEILNNEMILNDAGQMVDDEWLGLRERFPNIKLHEYIIMPNHFHAILEIVEATLVVASIDNNASTDDVSTTLVVASNDDNAQNDNVVEKGHPRVVDPTVDAMVKTLGDMVGAFQSITTVEYINGVKTKNWKQFNKKLWQRNYWEHIIRNEKSLHNISEYIINNPKNWTNDKLK